ncbi:hypothetical protein [Burkholderia latens]|uniref:hypothetical protein n=1 Tax=Burkholderia latens TaxID=488446 RepID=UPI001AE9837B|nr:hypothetical protein [Burkholderia latens]QTO45134.1 hypothetical protein J8I85_22010 [Burkholderia latens]
MKVTIAYLGEPPSGSTEPKGITADAGIVSISRRNSAALDAVTRQLRAHPRSAAQRARMTGF